MVKTAFDGWLAPEGLVLDSRKGLVGPGWTIRGTGAVTVGEGRVVYTRGRDLRVRRIRGGLDRVLLRLPAGEFDLAAGSFGIAIASPPARGVKLYRLPWRTIDKTLDGALTESSSAATRVVDVWGEGDWIVRREICLGRPWLGTVVRVIEDHAAISLLSPTCRPAHRSGSPRATGRWAGTRGTDAARGRGTAS